MKDRIRFEKHMQASTLQNPMMGGQLDTQQIEVRRDPLIGTQSLFNARLEDKVAMFVGATDVALVERLAKESEPRCFLCGDKWKQMTPTYPESVVPGGRLQKGEVVLFPNLFPISQVHAVVRVGARHYLPLGEFDAGLLRDALEVSIDFSRMIAGADPSVGYLTIDANYLAPAGASIAHPHFQVVGGDVPCSWLEGVLSASRAWREKHGSCYWTDLLEQEEELGERLVGKTGDVTWLAAYSPQGANEVMGILTGKRDFLEVGDEELADMADGLSRLLRGYDAMGVSTFNLAIYSGPLGGGDDAFRCCVRLISRQNVYENYRTDDYFLQKLLRNELILTTPETLASRLRPLF